MQKQIHRGDPNQEAKLGHQPHCAVDDSLVKTVSVPSLEVASARSDHVCWIGDWNSMTSRCAEKHMCFLTLVPSASGGTQLLMVPVASS